MTIEYLLVMVECTLVTFTSMNTVFIVLHWFYINIPKFLGTVISF